MARSQRGFSLLEVIVTIAITTGVLLAISAAVSNSLHASANVSIRVALRDDALSALADLRASTAYDRAMLASLIGKSSTATIARDPAGPMETITVSVANVPSNGHANVVATAVVTQNSVSVTERQTLYVEAPPPGTTIYQ